MTTYTLDGNLITVFQKCPLFSTIECNRLFAILALFYEASVFSWRIAANRARAEQVARIEVATRDAVVCEHLWEGP